MNSDEKGVYGEAEETVVFYNATDLQVGPNGLRVEGVTIKVPPETLYQFKHNLNTGEEFLEVLKNTLSYWHKPTDSNRGWDICLSFHKGCFWLTSDICETEAEAKKSITDRVRAFRDLFPN